MLANILALFFLIVVVMARGRDCGQNTPALPTNTSRMITRTWEQRSS